MMKPRNSRPSGEASASGRAKAEALAAAGPAASNQATSAQAMRKRRSSINVYDQPSSLNARLRQLETDMLRLDEDRTKLFDDTHAALAQFEIRLNEIQSILKSRQDNVEKYVEEMKLLLAAKEEFERQSKSLNDRHERMQDKFMHRETTIARDIKMLKTKFELLEKNKQFRSIFQCKSIEKAGDSLSASDLGPSAPASESPSSGALAKSGEAGARESEGDSLEGERDPKQVAEQLHQGKRPAWGPFGFLRRWLATCNPFGLIARALSRQRAQLSRRSKTNRVSSLELEPDNQNQDKNDVTPTSDQSVAVT